MLFFCQPTVRPAPSRFVSLARNCQVSQGDASQELVVSTAHWMFLKATIWPLLFMMFLGTERRLACVCALASRPTTDPRHHHARTRALTARCACKKRTRRPYHRRSRRVSPFIAVRVGEATHPGPLSTKHLRCPHCPTWLSHRSSLRKHILRFHEPPPLFSSPVLSEWSFSETDAVEEDKRELSARLRLMESRPSVLCLT